MAKSICVLARMECPKTGDMTAKAYCPHWKVGVPEHEKDGSGRVVALNLYTGCQLPKLIPYLQSMTAEVDHTHVAANQARDSAIEAREQLRAAESTLNETLVQMMTGAVLGPIMESLEDGERKLIAGTPETQ